jgi:hypothetical protein
MAHEEHLEEPEDFSPDDPAEINDNEREALRQDLIDVRTLKAVLGSRGVRGVMVYCPDCDDDHFLGWDLLAGNLQQILESGEPPVHEPAWEPDPDEYVTWDYARGFLDGYETYPEERAGEDACGYCGNKLPEGGYDWAHCPSCGKELAAVNLVFELRRRGWSRERIAELLERAGFDPPLYDPDGVEGFAKPQKPATEEDDGNRKS